MGESALEEPHRLRHLREAARTTAVRQFDLETALLPRWNALFDDLIHNRRPELDDV